MFKDATGKIVLEIDQRLGNITNNDLKITEAQFFDAIKGYKLAETVEQLAITSKRMFMDDYPKEWFRMGKGGIQHPCGVYFTQFAIEYLSCAMILSGSNDWKDRSIKNKDNFIGLFNIYHNGLIQEVSAKSGITSLLIPMHFQQFVSQDDHKDAFARQWYLFHKVNERLNGKGFEDINAVFLKEVGISVLDYTKLCFVIFATIINNPRFNIGDMSGITMSGLRGVLDKEKMFTFLDLISSDYKSFREIDQELNKNLDPKYTKTRLNPLWIKPIIRMGENDFLASSVTAYGTATFNGLFWWFDNHYRKQSRVKGDEFRSYFGSLFEEYTGDVIKDIYIKETVSPQIEYGTKKSGGLFFDWIVTTKDKVFLFETKGYQFPLAVLQKGEAESIEAEVIKRMVNTILQMYKRVKDVELYDELKHLRGKNLISIAVFYDIPLVSTPMYREIILPELEKLEATHKGIKDFRYYFISIDELENYYYASENIDVDVILEEVNKNNQTGFSVELGKANGGKQSTTGNILDRAFNEYCSDVIGVEDEK